MHDYTKDESFSTLLKQNLSVIAVIILAYAADYLLNIYLARKLSPKSYGEVSVILNILYFCIPLALLGTEEAGLRFIPQYFKNHAWGKLKGYLIWNYKLIFKIFILTNAISLLAIFFVTEFIHWGILSKNISHPFVYSIWLIPLVAYLYLQSVFLQILHKFSLSVITMEVALPLLLFVILVCFIFLGKQLGVPLVIFGIGATCILIICFQFYIIVKNIPRQVTRSKSLKSDSKTKTTWLKTSLTMLKGTIIYYALDAIGIILLEILGGNEADVAKYAVITTIAYIIFLLEESLGFIITPRITSLIRSRKKLQMVLDNCNKIKIIPVLLIYLVIVFFGKNILGLFGKEYISVYTPLIILSTVDLIAFILVFSGYLLYYTHYIHYYIRITQIELATLVILSCILIPFYHLMGIVIATAITQIGAQIFYIYYVRKLMKIKAAYFV